MDNARHRRNLVMAAVVIFMLAGFAAYGTYQDIEAGVSSYAPRFSKTRSIASATEDFGLYCYYLSIQLTQLGALLGGAIALLWAAWRKEH